MRFTVLRVRNRDAPIPGSWIDWIDYSITLEELDTETLQGEIDHLEGIPLPREWDEELEAS
jgi:hypothetical protein